jgi:hypothetical protein
MLCLSGILAQSERELNGYFWVPMAKQGLKASGAPMTIYTATDDTNFQFQAAVPVEQVPTLPAGSEIAVGKSAAGKALMFIHRGSYEALAWSRRHIGEL